MRFFCYVFISFSFLRPTLAADPICQKWFGAKHVQNINRFPASDVNDGSDACRHFVWAILLSNKFSETFAKLILDAHENSRFQPDAEKQMDDHNNQLGLEVARSTTKKADLSQEEILKLFDKAVKDGKLNVIGKPQ